MLKKLFKKLRKNKKGNVVQLVIFAPFLMILLIFCSIEITCNVEANNLDGDITTLLRQMSKAESYSTALTIVKNNVGKGKSLRNEKEKEDFINSIYFYEPINNNGVLHLGNPVSVASSSIDVSTLWKNGNIIEINFERQLIDSSISEITVTNYTFSLFKDSVSIHRRIMIEGSTINNEGVVG